MRRLALALSLALLGACTQDPPGRCGADLDCLPGQICTDGLCLPLVTDHQIGSLCARDTDCVAWGECLANACTLRAGACEIDGHCDGWEVCADHACALAVNGCADEAACGFWQDCVAYRCATAAGYCGDDAPCQAWQYCDAGHTCVDVGGTCTVDGDCEAWQYCASGHCANQPGLCGTTAECDPDWQVCDAGHSCVTAAGRCGSSLDCPAWESCSRSWTCAPAIACTSGVECASTDTCTRGICSPPAPFDPGGVALFGTLAEGACALAVAPLQSPTRASVGFACTWGEAAVDPAGGIVYRRDEGPSTLHRHVPDPWEWDAQALEWAYPSSPLANDPLVPTPACASATLQAWVIQAGTGEILHACTGDDVAGYDYYDTQGGLRVSGYVVRAWNGAGVKLATRNGTTWVLLDPDNVETPLTDGPGALPTFVAARATGPGFFLVVDQAGALERWWVGPDGAARRQGIYSVPPAEVTRTILRSLDGSGSLHEMGYRATGEDVVVRCGLDPAGCEVVYDEANALAPDYTVTPPRVYVLVHISSILTGP